MAKSKTGIKEAFDKLEYNNAEDKYPQNSFFKGLEAPSRQVLNTDCELRASNTFYQPLTHG